MCCMLVVCMFGLVYKSLWIIILKENRQFFIHDHINHCDISFPIHSCRAWMLRLVVILLIIFNFFYRVRSPLAFMTLTDQLIPRMSAFFTATLMRMKARVCLTVRTRITKLSIASGVSWKTKTFVVQLLDHPSTHMVNSVLKFQ